MKFALCNFIATIIFAHVFLDKLYLSPKIGQLVAVVETHEHTSVERYVFYLNLTPIGKSILQR
jgi:hypothetical protein